MIIQDKRHLSRIDESHQKKMKNLWNRPDFKALQFQENSGELSNEHRIGHIPFVQPSYKVVKNNRSLGEFI